MENLSVIIPHKNSLNSLIEILNCIPDRVQVIVVDDKSEQQVQKQLYGLENENWTFIFNNFYESNAGFARNLGIESLKDDCKWVMFADADDLLDRNNLDDLIDRLEYEESDVVLTGVDAQMLGGGPSVRADYIHRLLDGYPNNKKEILFNWVGPIGKVISRDLIDKNNLRYESRLASNDVVFSTRLAALNPSISVFKKSVYTIIQSDSSLTATLSVEKAKSRLEALWERNKIISKSKSSVRLSYGASYYKFIILNGSLREAFLYLPGTLKNIFLAFKVNLLRSV